jgi:radical SAM protein with 4Fe4S-binding SPASM domain
METHSFSDKFRHYVRHPAYALASTGGNLKRVLRLCYPPAKMINTIRAKLSKNAEVIKCTPRHIIFFVSDRCNMSCHWCLRNSDQSKAIQHSKIADMTVDVFNRILGSFPALEAISFTGQGEPLMNKDLLQMMDIARQRRLTCLLTTNGLLLDEERIEAMIRAKVFRVNISLKGKDPGEYEITTGRGKDAFESNLDNIRRCVSLKRKHGSDMIVRMSYVVDRKCLGNMEEVIILAENLGVDCLQFNTLIPFDDFEGADGCLFEDDQDAKDHMDGLRKRPSPLDIEFPILLRRDRFTHYCAGYHEFLNVDADGNVSGCMRDLTPNANYGNVFRDNSPMNTEHFRSMRKMFKSRKLPTRCKLCIEMSR